MDANHNELSNSEIIERLKALELRMSRMESGYLVESSASENHEKIESYELDVKMVDGSLIESKIGESGLAWLGNIVLFFGIIFLVGYVVLTMVAAFFIRRKVPSQSCSGREFLQIVSIVFKLFALISVFMREKASSRVVPLKSLYLC